MVIEITERLRERLEEMFMPEPNSGCWLWLGHALPTGYGMISLGGGKKVYAHRLAYAINTGSWPEVVRHKCDNPACVNPEHLLGGTTADNIADKVRRRRHHFGERTPSSKLTEYDVLSILLFLDTNSHTNEELSQRFGVTFGTISKIKLGTRWKHITRYAA